MLTSQEFIIDGYQITLDRALLEETDEDLSSITVKKSGEDHKFIELPTPVMRKLVHILKDSPYIFSESNK